MACSQDLSLEIQSVENGEMAVLLTADKQWLQDADRSYPVKIDPYVFQSTTKTEQDATAMYKKAASYPNGTLVFGNGKDYGKTKTYIKFDLPALAAGDMVVGGRVNLRQYSGEIYGYSYSSDSPQYKSLQINAYQVVEKWTESAIINSVAFSGLPSRNSTVLDFQTVSGDTRGKWTAFDITALTKKWYEGIANYGICLEAADPEAKAVACFFSTDNEYYPECRPTLEVSYLNAKGLEGRWTTHTQSLGRSGSSYINDYTGNLVWVHTGLGFSGNRMPVSINAVYNANDKGNKAYGLGYGWRTNYNQRVEQITLGGTTYYRWEDEDGTRHYFMKKSAGLYVDELEPTRQLTDTGSGTKKFCITEKSGSKRYFDTSGRLA